jgi:NitT/TauT family transport system permease protein
MRFRFLVGPSAILALWALLAYTHTVSPLLLASPHEVLVALAKLLGSGALASALLATTSRTLAGFAVSAVIGIPVGLVVGSSSAIREELRLVIDFCRSLPPTALLPLFLFFFGVGDLAKILLSGFSCALIIVLGTSEGVIGCNQMRLKLATAFGASRWALLFRVIFPESLPSIAVALRTCLSLSLILVVVAEMYVGTGSGLGRMIADSHLMHRTSEMYATIAAAGLLGYALNWGLRAVAVRVVHWSGK